MKKSIVLLIVSILFISISAQAEHLKFMGIPLTGTITQFQQKLVAKGITYNKKASAAAPIGTRFFSGKFAGSKAEIIVWYDADTKIVYGAKAVYECHSTTIRDSKYNELKPLLSTKYAEEYIQTGDRNGHEAFIVNVKDDSGESIGGVFLYCDQEEFPYNDIYYVYVEYMDTNNYLKNEGSKMKDL